MLNIGQIVPLRDAGFRPGSRATVVSTKVTKTHVHLGRPHGIGLPWTHGGGPTSSGSNKGRALMRTAVRVVNLKVVDRGKALHISLLPNHIC